MEKQKKQFLSWVHSKNRIKGQSSFLSLSIQYSSISSYSVPIFTAITIIILPQYWDVCLGLVFSASILLSLVFIATRKLVQVLEFCFLTLLLFSLHCCYCSATNTSLSVVLRWSLGEQPEDPKNRMFPTKISHFQCRIQVTYLPI